MTHGTQAPETPGERAATHAPKTELPTLTQAHVAALMYDGKGAAHMRLLKEALSVLRALVSGEAKLVPTEELWRCGVVFSQHRYDEPEFQFALQKINRWLTPEDERHE